MTLSGEGKIIIIRSADISVIGHTQGVKVTDLDTPEKVVAVAR
jgi:hypothetical protein